MRREFFAIITAVIRVARTAGLAIFPVLPAVIAACAGAHAAPPPRIVVKPTVVSHPAQGVPSLAPRAIVPSSAEHPAPECDTLPPLSATWGTADPLTVIAASPDRRWIAVCQARRDTNGDGKVRVDISADGTVSGDELAGYLLAAPGPGTAIDAFVGSDPTGRFVAFVRQGRLVLRDTATQMDTELPGDVRDDLSPFVHPRAVSFDPTGHRMLYLQKLEHGGKIVVRELSTRAETIVDPGDGLVYRADFDPSGEAIVVRVVTADTNQNGRLDWPVREADTPRMRCAAPLPRFAVWERGGDEAALRVAPAQGGVARDAPGLVVPMGGALLVREADGALARVEPSGKRLPVARGGCDARLLHVDAARGLALVTCLDAKGKNEAVLVGHGPAKQLGLALSVAPGDHFVEGAPRLVPLHPGTDAALLDLDRREVEMLTNGDRILATSGARALVLRGRSLVVHELGSSDAELGEIVPLSHMLRSGSVVFVPPFVVDVALGELLGRSEERALAVASDGALLVATGGAADAAHFARGPLEWKAPARAAPLASAASR